MLVLLEIMWLSALWTSQDFCGCEVCVCVCVFSLSYIAFSNVITIEILPPPCLYSLLFGNWGQTKESRDFTISCIFKNCF